MWAGMGTVCSQRVQSVFGGIYAAVGDGMVFPETA